MRKMHWMMPRMRFEDYLDEVDRVAFVFTVDEGPQYLVGNVTIQHGRRVDGEFQSVDPALFPDLDR